MWNMLAKCSYRNRWTVWHFNWIIRCKALLPIDRHKEKQQQQQQKRFDGIVCEAVDFFSRLNFFAIMHIASLEWMLNTKREKERSKPRSQPHRKLYAYFLWNAKWHSFVLATIDKYRGALFCVHIQVSVGGIDADHDQRNLNIFLTIDEKNSRQVCTRCASGNITNA